MCIDGFSHTVHLMQWSWSALDVFLPLPVTAGDACVELVQVIVLFRPVFVLLRWKKLG